jgi:hypothetical protein
VGRFDQENQSVKLTGYRFVAPVKESCWNISTHLKKKQKLVRESRHRCSTMASPLLKRGDKFPVQGYAPDDLRENKRRFSACQKLQS